MKRTKQSTFAKRERQEQGAGFAPVGGTQFTPGPWHLEHDVDGIPLTIIGSDGSAIGTVETWNDCTEGNRLVLTAAPAMYEALSELVKYLREQVADEALDTWAPVFKAAMALAQAEGRQG